MKEPCWYLLNRCRNSQNALLCLNFLKNYNVFSIAGDTTNKPALVPGALVLPGPENPENPTSQDIPKSDMLKSDDTDSILTPVSEPDFPGLEMSEPEFLKPDLIDKPEAMEIADDQKSDVTDMATDSVPFTEDTSTTDVASVGGGDDDVSSVAPSEDHSDPGHFFRRKITSPSPAMKFRITCQCGAANCRKYLF